MLKLNKEFKVRLEVFKNDKRAYFSFLVLAFLFLATLPAELICNVRPLMIVVEGKPYFPIPFTYSEKDFGGTLPSEPDYKSARFLNILKGVPAPSIKAETKNSFGLQLDDFEEEDVVEEPAFSITLDDFEDSDEAITPTNETQNLSQRPLDTVASGPFTTTNIFRQIQKPVMLCWQHLIEPAHPMVKVLLKVPGKMGITLAPMTGAAMFSLDYFMAFVFR